MSKAGGQRVALCRSSIARPPSVIIPLRRDARRVVMAPPRQYRRQYRQHRRTADHLSNAATSYPLLH